MKVLFVTPYVPSEVRVRPFHLIRELTARGHQVGLATVLTGAGERQDLERLRPYVRGVWAFQVRRWRSLWNCLRALPSDTPLQAVYCWHPRFAARLMALALGEEGPKFDLVHVEHLRVAPYGVALRAAAQALSRRMPVIWDSVDCISLLMDRAAERSLGGRGTRLVAGLERGRTRQYEGRLVRTFDHTLVTSETDRRALLALAGHDPAGPVSVLPNGVDLDRFAEPNGKPRDENRIVMSGKMSYHANVTMAVFFATKVLPLILAHRPQVRLTIVGKDPPAAVRRLADHPAVEVTGTVPDLRPYLQGAAVAVAPTIYGVGIQNKVLEAMACGTPVVASAAAASGLSAKPGEGLLVGETPEQMAEAVLRLLEDEDLRSRVGRAGRRYVERNHRWSDVAKKLEAIYRESTDVQN